MMETLSYTEFSRRVHDGVRLQRVPSSGTIELTNRCPLACSHCYNNLPMNDQVARKRELTLSEYKGILDELADHGCLWLLFTGGEIFARRDFFDLYEYAKRKGFLITLFTNGILIDERVADRLAELPPFTIEITLYGNTRETYEQLTRIPGSFDRCMRAIDLLLERKLPLKLKTVAVSINAHEVFAMREFAESKGVEFKFDSAINPRIDCSSAPLAVRLTPAEIVEFDLRDSERADEYRRLVETCGPAPLVPDGSRKLYDCGGGINSFAIDPYGDLSICVLSHVDRFNLREGSFAEGWNGLLQTVRNKEATRPGKCAACQLVSICGSCPATAELENGDPETPVEFFCHVAHLRAAALGIDVAPHGDCDFCDTRRDELAAEAEALRLRVRDLPVVPSWESPHAAACGSGGCDSCHVR